MYKYVMTDIQTSCKRYKFQNPTYFFKYDSFYVFFYIHQFDAAIEW